VAATNNTRTVRDLANELTLAWDAEGEGRGRAIFLIGAGCSFSAGIPLAAGVAKYCATQLAEKFSHGVFRPETPEEALAWLQSHELMPPAAPGEATTNWGALYSEFFERHLKAPRRQRELISEIIRKAGDKLNWAHACLGELVQQRYVHTVLTTNFDQLVLKGIIRTGMLPVVADGFESLNRVDPRPNWPQVVHLHGSMHTYTLRNTISAMKEAGTDSNALTMMFGLLQDCDVLVIVGYAGGEDGVMDILVEVANRRAQLVVYWVAREAGYDNLSGKCRELLEAGDNKFLIDGGDADDFFGKLMTELGIGGPRWVTDPIGMLVEQQRQLEPPSDLDSVKVLVEAYKAKVDFAAEHRLPGANDAKTIAAQLHAQGKFAEAVDALGDLQPDADTWALRLRALSLLALFERTRARERLDQAMADFENLMARTAGAEHVENTLSLIDALFDLSETTDDPVVSKNALKRIVDLARDCTAADAPDGLLFASLELSRAQAAQSLAEQSGDDVDLLTDSVRAYDSAIAVMTEFGDSRIREARAGKAGALEVLGVVQNNTALVREAVDLHREVVRLAERTSPASDYAGTLMNFAGALDTLAVLAPDESGSTRPEAIEALRTAAKIYELTHDEMGLQDANERLTELEGGLGG
jgi:hypothetical protein